MQDNFTKSVPIEEFKESLTEKSFYINEEKEEPFDNKTDSLLHILN